MRHPRVTPGAPAWVVILSAVQFAAGSGATAAAPSAREIMERVTVTRKLDGSEATVKMTTFDGGGQPRERQLSMASKIYRLVCPRHADVNYDRHSTRHDFDRSLGKQLAFVGCQIQRFGDVQVDAERRGVVTE